MDYNENERIANEINNVANINDNNNDGLVAAQNLVYNIYNDIFNPVSWILQDNENVNDNDNENVNDNENENENVNEDADGDVVTDNSNLNDFDVVDDSEEVFTENLPIIPTYQIVTYLQNSDTDNDVLLSDIDSEADNHLENTIVDDCCICYKPCNAFKYCKYTLQTYLLH